LRQFYFRPALPELHLAQLISFCCRNRVLVAVAVFADFTGLRRPDKVRDTRRPIAASDFRLLAAVMREETTGCGFIGIDIIANFNAFHTLSQQILQHAPAAGT
jgi:hypothetical protein